MDNEPRPSWQQLIDWVEGRLAPAESDQVAAQVANAGPDVAAEVAADLAWIRAFVQASRTVVADEPPAQLRSALRAQFRDYARSQAAAEERPGPLQRLIAALSFDSGLQPGLAGARAAEGGATRQLVYATDVADISLSVQALDDGLRVDGQILPLSDEDPDGSTVHLYKDDTILAESSVDAAGLFVLTALAPDTYQLALSTATVTVVIEALNLHV